MKNMYKKKKGEPKVLTVGCVAVCEITTELQFPLYLLQNLCFFLYDYALFLQDLVLSVELSLIMMTAL